MWVSRVYTSFQSIASTALGLRFHVCEGELRRTCRVGESFGFWEFGAFGIRVGSVMLGCRFQG